jgi:RNA polymerase sigma-70 factor (family 1)
MIKDEAAILKMLARETPQAKAAFKSLYDEHAESIYATAKQFLKSHDLARDLVQEIFANIWLKRTTFTDINHFRSYLYIMTKNAAINHIMKMTKEALAGQEFSDRVELHDNSLLERHDLLLQKVLDELPPKRREVFQLGKLEGLSHEGIADRLNISPNTVSNHMKKALRFVKDRFHSTPTPP